jgi:hypothetical protein
MKAAIVCFCHSIACFACNFTHSQIYLISLSTDKSVRTLIGWAIGHVMFMFWPLHKHRYSRFVSSLRLKLNFICCYRHPHTTIRPNCLLLFCHGLCYEAVVYAGVHCAECSTRKWSWPNMPHYARRTEESRCLDQDSSQEPVEYKSEAPPFQLSV